jgi:hypothetical protein
MSMSQLSSQTFEFGLKALSAVLYKAQAFAEAKKIDPAVLLSWRLAPDMLPLVRQVQIAADQAKKGPPVLQASMHPASRIRRPRSNS